MRVAPGGSAPLFPSAPRLGRLQVGTGKQARQSNRNPKRMAELGLTGYGLERFAFTGNAKDWIERIEELAEVGASRLWISTEVGDLDREVHYMSVFTGEVMPHFR